MVANQNSMVSFHQQFSTVLLLTKTGKNNVWTVLLSIAFAWELRYMLFVTEMCTMTTECIGYVMGKWEAHKQLHNTAYQNTHNFDNSDARLLS